MDWFNDPSNPASPLSPLNPSNPASPLNPMNMTAHGGGGGGGPYSRASTWPAALLFTGLFAFLGCIIADATIELGRLVGPDVVLVARWCAALLVPSCFALAFVGWLVDRREEGR